MEMDKQPDRMRVRHYQAASGRGTGAERVVCVLLTSPDDILAARNNHVLNCLQAAGVSRSIGVYFYRFKNSTGPFIKIGECTRQEGISVRFQRGWHGTPRYSDSYLGKYTKDGSQVDSEFLRERIGSPNFPFCGPGARRDRLTATVPRQGGAACRPAQSVRAVTSPQESCNSCRLDRRLLRCAR